MPKTDSRILARKAGSLMMMGYGLFLFTLGCVFAYEIHVMGLGMGIGPHRLALLIGGGLLVIVLSAGLYFGNRWCAALLVNYVLVERYIALRFNTMGLSHTVTFLLVLVGIFLALAGLPELTAEPEENVKEE